MVLEEGTFTSKTDQSMVDYFIKLGAPKETVKGMLGLTFKFRIEIIEDGSWVVMTSCEEMSKFNSVEMYKVGQEKSVDSPIFGGKATVKLTPLGEHKWLVSCDSAGFGGKLEWVELYTEEGLKVTYKSPKAGTYEILWQREVKETGWFRMVKGENLEAFMKAQGLGSIETAGWSENMESLIKFTNDGSNCVLTEVWGNVTNVVRYKLDEEADYSWPGMPSMDRKFVTTKAGNGKYKSIMKGKNGEMEEWDLVFNTKGCVYSGLDHRSGQSCKMFYEPFTNIYGKFRPMALTGFHAYGEALGLPREIIDKLVTELDATLTIEKKANGLLHCVSESKVYPMDVTFRFNEEFEYTVPGMEKFKFVETLQGDTITYVGKSSKFSMSSTMKFTENFIIQTSKIVGTNVTTKTIFERI